MKTTTILTLLITITSTAACDSAVIGECVITPVGVQGITEDMDMDGAPDHAPFLVAEVSDGCEKHLAEIHVAMYENSDAVVLRGFGVPTMLSDTCALWTWPGATVITGEWAFAVTPVDGTSTGMQSVNVLGMSIGALLPAWRDGSEWTARLPAGIPSSCEY
jgi:hypothetical protein